MTYKLLAIGEVMAEIRQDEAAGFAVGFAGDTYNTAVYFARAHAAAGSVSYLTAIGTDPLSQAFRQAAADEGIDLSHTQTDPAKNIGVYAVATDAQGERSFSYWRSASAARQMFTAPGVEVGLPPAEITYLSGITLAILPPDARTRLMAHLRHRSQHQQGLIAFDPNYRPSLWENVEAARDCIDRVWEIADIALPSIDDEMTLFADTSEEAVIDRFAQRSWTACAIKRGARGPLSPGLTAAAHPAFPAAPAVVDTTAAGDSFNGAYLAALLEGRGEAACLSSGHAMASRVIGDHGAILPRQRG